MRKTLTALAFALVAMAAAGVARAEDPAGDWIGVVTTPGGALHVAIHLHATGAGAYAGTADSADQGAYDLPLSQVTATASHISFDLPVVHATYAGDWDPAGRQWKGVLTQKGAPLPLNLSRGVLPPAPVIAGMDGDWSGVLQVGPGMRLRLVFHIRTGPHGTLVKVDSVDQGAFGTPVPGFTRKGDHISMIIDAINVDYEADLKDSGKTMTGSFTQGPQSFPLTLTLGPPGAPPPPCRRPRSRKRPGGPRPPTRPSTRSSTSGSMCRNRASASSSA